MAATSRLDAGKWEFSRPTMHVSDATSICTVHAAPGFATFTDQWSNEQFPRNA